MAYDLGDNSCSVPTAWPRGYTGAVWELSSAPDCSGMAPNLAESLVEESLAVDGRDNTTALVIQVV